MKKCKKETLLDEQEKKNFASRVKELRKDRKWSRGQLEYKTVNTRRKITSSYINKIENGRIGRGIGNDVLQSLADVFGVSVDYLLCLTDDKTPDDQWNREAAEFGGLMVEYDKRRNIIKQLVDYIPETDILGDRYALLSDDIDDLTGLDDVVAYVGLKKNGLYGYINNFDFVENMWNDLIHQFEMILSYYSKPKPEGILFDGTNPESMLSDKERELFGLFSQRRPDMEQQ